MLLNVTRTTYPDGTVRHYLFGMTPPKLTNLGLIMKEAAKKEANRIINQPKSR